MPKYTFECPECVLKFERNLRVGEHPMHECPSCHDPAPLVVTQFGFAFAENNGSPANSGVHGSDYPTADQAVGRSASNRWAHISAREKVKKEAREQGATPALIRHTGKDFIDYEPMSDAGRAARRKLVKEAVRISTEGEKPLKR
jgi:putative FmdB family regulatory protein